MNETIKVSPQSFMKSMLLALFLASATLCAGQLTPTPDANQNLPGQSTGSAPAQSPVNAPAMTTPALSQSPAEGQPLTPYSGPTATYPGTVTMPTSVIAPLTTRSEFEIFAEDTAGYPLPVYGRQLFYRVPATFAPMDRMPVPAGYVLGPGDQLLIRVWGKVDLNSAVTVDRNGQIFLPKIGVLSVAGLRDAQIEDFLRAAIGNLYKGFELNVSMGRLRSIQIFVLGSARQPGTYTVSGLSTLVDALFVSGGPSATGSMRHIQLRRDGQTVTDFDLYDLLRRGDKSHDAQLQAGDVIYIPPVGPQIAVMGSVAEPGIYELNGKTTIAAALKDAGGLSNLAETDRVLLERIVNHRRRGLDDFELDASGLGREMEDGDMLRILPISPKFDNAVTLRGSVAQPGRFSWHEGMRVDDLIPSRDFLITRRYWNQQNHLVPPSDELLAQRQQNYLAQLAAALGNSVQLSLPPRFGTASGGAAGNRNAPGYAAQPDASYGNSAGSALSQTNPALAAAPPGGAAEDSGQANYSAAPAYPNRSDALASPYAQPAYPSQQGYPDGGTGNNAFRGNSEIDDYLAADPRTDPMPDLDRSNAEINWDYAVIERLDEHDLSTRLIPFDLGKALDDPTSAENQKLQPRDVITIFARRDLPLPEDKRAAFVYIAGEVRAPGVYRIEPGETLRAVIERAGGLTEHAYLYASQLTRVSVRTAEEKQLRQSIDQMRQELLGHYSDAASMDTNLSDQQKVELAGQQSLLAQLSNVHPAGRVVLNMPPRASSLDDIPNFPLDDGDRLYIPPRMDTVQVAGAVYNTNAFRYQPNKRVEGYLRDAGGPTRQADAGRAFLLRADGSVVSKHMRGTIWSSNFEHMALLPGDAIIVPVKMKPINSLAQQLPFTTIAQLATQIATVAVIARQ